MENIITYFLAMCKMFLFGIILLGSILCTCISIILISRYIFFKEDIDEKIAVKVKKILLHKFVFYLIGAITGFITIKIFLLIFY